MAPMKLLMVICDGMADRPSDDLDGKTPMEAADTPVMDELAGKGQCGLMNPIGIGIVPGSDTAHLSLLGYDPYKYYCGRGTLEAAGLGIYMKPGDVAFRCNFATSDADLRILDRRAGRISSGTNELAEAINSLKIEDVRIIFKDAVEHRSVMVLRGRGLSFRVSETDPHHEGEIAWKSKALEPAAEKTARILNHFTQLSFDILDAHPLNQARREEGLKPANIILARGPGDMPDIPNFMEYHGLKAEAIVGITLVKGLCRILGMEVPEIEGATGGADTDLDAKMKAAANALSHNDFVLLHIKGTDVFGHDGDARGKRDYIQRVDGELGNLIARLGDDVLITITADHSTPVSVMDHAPDPVPLLVYGKGLRSDRVMKFSELEASSGSLGMMNGQDLMPLLKGLAGWNEKFGA